MTVLSPTERLQPPIPVFGLPVKGCDSLLRFAIRIAEDRVARARMRFQRNCAIEIHRLTRSSFEYLSCAGFDARGASDRLRSLPEPGGGIAIVPREEAFGSAVQDIAQSIPGALRIVDPRE